jgi:hypothetical protein
MRVVYLPLGNIRPRQWISLEVTGSKRSLTGPDYNIGTGVIAFMRLCQYDLMGFGN